MADAALATPESDDLRAQLSAAMDTEIESPSTDAAPAASADAAEAESSPDSAASPDKSDHPSDPLRYADGTFKPVKAKDDTAPAATAKANELPSKDTQAKVSEPVPNPADAPPVGWTAEAKAEWSKLSPALKASVLKREAEISNGGRQWSDEKRRYETALAPIATEAQRLGIPTDQAINALMAAHHSLNRDAPNAIRQLARQYGVDLATLAGTQAADVSRETIHQPDIAALVRQAVQPIIAPLQDRFAAEDRRQQESTVETVTAFATSPGHEHFDAVSGELQLMVPWIRDSNPSWTHERVLQEAYDRAVHANPLTRAALQAANAASAETKRQEDAKQRAIKARVAGSSVTGSPSGAAAPQAHAALRDVISAAYDGAGSN